MHILPCGASEHHRLGVTYPCSSPQRAAEEMSDVLIYLLQLADVLDVDLVPAAEDKLAAAARRYPAVDGVATDAPLKE